MDTILQWLHHYGLIVVFANVLLAQLGLPVPAYPVLIFTGALSTQGRYPIAALLPTAVAASLIADSIWYWGGRRLGSRVLRMLCRISLSPDSCVMQTESIYARWGVKSLAVAKFIPGFAAIATAVSGSFKVPYPTFLFFDAIGAALWAGVALALGVVFNDEVNSVLDVMGELGRIGLMTLAAAFVLFLIYKWQQRWRFRRALRMARISVDELGQLIEAGAEPAVLDVRSPASRTRDGFIPGSIHWVPAGGADQAAQLRREQDVIVYCACPNEASAALVAKHLLNAGFHKVRPLHGGIEAWVASGRAVAH